MARTIEVNFGLNKPQREGFEHIGPGQTVCFALSRGAGKSWFVRNVAWLLVAQYFGKVRPGALKPLRGIRIVALMDTHKHFVDVHRTALLNELEEDWAFLGGKVNKTTLRVDFPDGSWFQPFPADQHTSKSALGLRCDVVIFDECDDIPISTFDTVVRPWFSEPWSLKIRLAAGTPRRGRHGLLYHLFKLGKSDAPENDNYHSVHATYLDVPETVDPVEVEDAKRNSPPATFKREWLCDFDAAEGLVYGDVFNERFHVHKPPPGTVFNSLIIGMDHGYESPGSAHLIGCVGSGADSTAYVLEEVYERRRTTDWWADKLKYWVMREHPARITLYADPSQPQAIEQYRQQTGVNLPRKKVDNNVDDGIATVATMFNKLRRSDGSEYARLYISPDCPELIRELGLYRYRKDPKDADLYLNDVEKRNDHACDGVRYALHNHLGPALSCVQRLRDVN